MTTAAKRTTTPRTRGEDPTTGQNRGARGNFVVASLNMSWQLALVVLVPLVGGAQLDKVTHRNSLWVLVGLGIALLGSIAVMWRAMRAANRLPVPKLTTAQKRAVQKSYEEDDD